MDSGVLHCEIYVAAAVFPSKKSCDKMRVSVFYHRHEGTNRWAWCALVHDQSYRNLAI